MQQVWGADRLPEAVSLPFLLLRRVRGVAKPGSFLSCSLQQHPSIAGIDVATYASIKAVKTKSNEIRALIRVINDGLCQERNSEQTVQGGRCHTELRHALTREKTSRAALALKSARRPHVVPIK